MITERGRIEHGLDKINPQRIVSILKEAIKTQHGLEHAIKLFGIDCMPSKKVKHCVRFNKDYDPQIEELLFAAWIIHNAQGQYGTDRNALGSSAPDVMPLLILMVSTVGTATRRQMVVKSVFKASTLVTKKCSRRELGS